MNADRNKYPFLKNTYVEDFPDGWEAIINYFLENVLLLLQSMNGIKLHVGQFKEKWGGLRFYYYLEFPEYSDEKDQDYIANRMEFLVDTLEKDSYYTCQNCGKDENIIHPTINGYVYTLCSDCFNEDKDEAL